MIFYHVLGGLFLGGSIPVGCLVGEWPESIVSCVWAEIWGMRVPNTIAGLVQQHSSTVPNYEGPTTRSALSFGHCRFRLFKWHCYIFPLCYSQHLSSPLTTLW